MSYFYDRFHETFILTEFKIQFLRNVFISLKIIFLRFVLHFSYKNPLIQTK